MFNLAVVFEIKINRNKDKCTHKLLRWFLLKEYEVVTKKLLYALTKLNKEYKDYYIKSIKYKVKNPYLI